MELKWKKLCNISNKFLVAISVEKKIKGAIIELQNN